MTVTGQPRFSGLWRHADFLKLWLAQSVSSFGARITREGLPYAAAITLGASPFEIGLLSACTRGPALAIGLFGGGFVDRSRRRPIMIAADIGRALVLASVPIAAVTHWLTIGQLFIVAALIGALNWMFELADHAYLPSLIAREQLIEGNSKLALTESIAEIGGPGAYGLLFTFLTAPLAITVNAATYLFSAMALAAIRKPEPPIASSALTGAPAHAASDFLTGLGVALKQPSVRPLLIVNSLTAFFGSFFSALYIIWAMRDLKMSPAMFGATVSVGGVAALFGAALAGPAIRRLGIGPAFAVTNLIGAAGTFFIPMAWGGPVIGMMMLMVSQVLGDSFGTVAEIAGRSIRQTQVPPEVLGRVGGVFAALAGVTGIVGPLLGGLLADQIGHRGAMLVASAGLTLITAYALFTPLMRLKDTTLPPDEDDEDDDVAAQSGLLDKV